MQVICFSIGVDISKDFFHAVIMRVYANRKGEAVASRKFKNSLTGFKAFVKWIDRKTTDARLVHIGMEATGRYHEGLAYYMLEHPYRQSVVLPNKIKSFSRSLNEYSKNDALDASLIARYVAMHVPSPWQPLSPLMRQLRELSRERQSLVNMRTMAKNRSHALNSGHRPLRDTVKRLRKQIQFYDGQISQIEKEMDALSQQDEALLRSHDLLVSVPYIGSVTAYTILAETDGFVLFENR
ncbi:MAG: transposase, partial [Bacteroidota bacterium]